MGGGGPLAPRSGTGPWPVLLFVYGGGWDSEKDIANAVRSYLYEEIKRRPMVLVTLSKT